MSLIWWAKQKSTCDWDETRPISLTLTLMTLEVTREVWVQLQCIGTLAKQIKCEYCWTQFPDFSDSGIWRRSNPWFQFNARLHYNSIPPVIYFHVIRFHPNWLTLSVWPRVERPLLQAVWQKKKNARKGDRGDKTEIPTIHPKPDQTLQPAAANRRILNSDLHSEKIELEHT